MLAKGWRSRSVLDTKNEPILDPKSAMIGVQNQTKARMPNAGVPHNIICNLWILPVVSFGLFRLALKRISMTIVQIHIKVDIRPEKYAPRVKARFGRKAPCRILFAYLPWSALLQHKHVLQKPRRNET